MTQEICIYAKPPIPGRTKSRLAADIGDEAAAALALALLRDTIDQALTVPAARVSLWHPPEASPGDFAGLVPEGLVYVAQDGSDLGERMSHTFCTTLGGDISRAVLIGSDCATHSVASLSRALTELETHQVVLEPADDGGYVLVGQSLHCAAMFHDVAWGEGMVMETSRQRLNAAGIKWLELPETFDIDYADDLAKLRAFVADHKRPHTAAWLERHSDR